MSETRRDESGDSPLHPLAYDMTDRLNKSLRLAKCKPGEMRVILGVSESTMTNYLQGVTVPKDGLLRQWAFRCQEAGVTFEWLKHGTLPALDDPDGEAMEASRGSGHPSKRTSRCKVLSFVPRQLELLPLAA